MAEMTAAEAVERLTFFSEEDEITVQNLEAIIKLIERQAAEIERLKGKYSDEQVLALFKIKDAEIAKKDRMLDMACHKLGTTSACSDMHRISGCCLDCKACWLAWLEKEAEGEA